MKYFPFPILIPALLYCSNLMAQASDAQDSVPLFDVEIVIFKNNQVPRGREYILPISSPLKADKILELSSAASVAAAKPMGYEFLPVEQLRLIEVVADIVGSTRYELLLHSGWRQPGLDLDKALPVWIKGGRIFGIEYTSIDNRIEGFSAQQRNSEVVEFNQQTLQQPVQPTNEGGLYELEGKITVTLSRYLHAYVDLVLRRPRLASDALPSSAEQDLINSTYSTDTRILNNHNLKEHRRMRSKNLHFLDNPEFGMLILITPYKLPENFVEAPIEEELNAEAGAGGTGNSQ